MLKSIFVNGKILILSYKNSYFLHWNFDWKSCFVVFFLKWNEWKNPQSNFSCQNLRIERNFFKWDGIESKILHLLFHRIWKNIFTIFPGIRLVLVLNFCHLQWNAHRLWHCSFSTIEVTWIVNIWNLMSRSETMWDFLKHNFNFWIISSILSHYIFAWIDL